MVPVTAYSLSTTSGSLSESLSALRLRSLKRTNASEKHSTLRAVILFKFGIIYSRCDPLNQVISEHFFCYRGRIYFDRALERIGASTKSLRNIKASTPVLVAVTYSNDRRGSVASGLLVIPSIGKPVHIGSPGVIPFSSSKRAPRWSPSRYPAIVSTDLQECFDVIREGRLDLQIVRWKLVPGIVQIG